MNEKVKKMKENFWKPIYALTNLFFPLICRACGRSFQNPETSIYCPACFYEFQGIRWPFCVKCGRQLKEKTFRGAENPLCVSCRNSTHFFAWARGISMYEGRFKEIVRAIKFEERASLARPLARLGAKLIQDDKRWRSDFPQVIIPVPMTRTERRRRGIHPAGGFGKSLSCLLNISYNKRVLRKIRETLKQSRLTRKERKENVKEAFKCKKDFSSSHVLLVDDIQTTGVTLSACAAALRQSGVQKITCLTMAIQPS